MNQFQDLHSVRSSRSQPNRAADAVVSAPVYSVGEPFRRRCLAWPPGAALAYGPWGFELTLFQSTIDKNVVTDVWKGSAEFALIVEPTVIVLIYRFGESIPWSDVPFSWHLQPEERRLIPAISRLSEARSLVWVTLVGAHDGIIYAQRGMTLSPSFTRVLNHAIRDQASRAFDPNECTATISRIYLKNPAPADRLALAAVRSSGNA